MTDLLIENLAEIATPIGTTPRRGAEQRAVLRLRAGSGSSAGSAGSTGSDASDASGVEILCRAGRLACRIDAADCCSRVGSSGRPG